MGGQRPKGEIASSRLRARPVAVALGARVVTQTLTIAGKFVSPAVAVIVPRLGPRRARQQLREGLANAATGSFAVVFAVVVTRDRLLSTGRVVNRLALAIPGTNLLAPNIGGIHRLHLLQRAYFLEDT